MLLYSILAFTLLFSLFGMQKNSQAAKKYLLYVNTGICMVYLMWRFFVVPTGHWLNWLYGSLLLLAEILGLIQFFHMQFLFARPYRIVQKKLSDFSDQLPTVDVLICTYNESCHLLERTILGALNLNYEKSRLNIYVCDDGNRPEVASLCKTFKIGYLTRDTNDGAKAGNLNHALLHTRGEFFAVLDADMICTREFLSRTMGYFTDPRTAFVQTPQIYYNKDMYQRNLKRDDIPNEQDFFMRDIQTGRAAINAVLHVGTNAIFRRTAILEVGMYPTNSITEDMAVGLLLQAHGYLGVFINEMLVLGISVSNYTDLAIQRDRWCRGNLQVIRNLKPFWKSGLNFRQKFAYLDGMLYWFTCFQKMIYILYPLLFLCFGIRSLDTDIRSLGAFFLPYFIGSILIFKTVAPSTRSMKWAHIYEIAMAPHTCVSVVKELFSFQSDFKVTPKEKRHDRGYFHFQVILPHMILAVLTLFSWGISTYSLLHSPLYLSAYIFNMAWSIYNLTGILICIRTAYQLADTTPYEHSIIGENKHTQLEFHHIRYRVKLSSLSEQSIKIFHSERISIQNPEPSILHLPFRDSFVTLSGILKPEESTNSLVFTFDVLDQKQKLALMNFYLTHLKPIYPISQTQQYESTD